VNVDTGCGLKKVDTNFGMMMSRFMMDSFANNSINPQRRSGLDRRAEKMHIFDNCKYWLNGRRAYPRREEDRQKSYRMDRYDAKTFAAVLTIITLSILDAILTMYLISLGAIEVNPIMAYFLEYGPLKFFGVKYFLTCASIVLLLLNKNVYLFKHRIRTEIVFIGVVILFASVVLWELYLILFVL
jgi:hypothetical protein